MCSPQHAPLARFSDDRHREAEITGAFEILKARGQDVDFVSLPFGMQTTVSGPFRVR